VPDGAHSHGGGFMGPGLGAAVVLILGAYLVETIAKPMARAAAPVGSAVGHFIDMLTVVVGGILVLAAAGVAALIVYKVKHRNDPPRPLTVNRVQAAPAPPRRQAVGQPRQAALPPAELHVHFHGDVPAREQARIVREARARLDAGDTS